MNARLYIAAHALQGLLTTGAARVHEARHAAAWAIAYADALLEQLAKVSPPVPAEPPAPPADASGAGEEGWKECQCGALELPPGAAAREGPNEIHSVKGCVGPGPRTPPDEAARRAREIRERIEKGGD